MKGKGRALQHHLTEFETFERGPGAAQPAWLRSLRREAIESFSERGFPSTRVEEWRYTNMTAVADEPFYTPGPDHAPISRKQVEEISFPVFACSLFVFVNGYYDPELSAPKALSGELRVESLAALLAENPEALEGQLTRCVDTKVHPFAALNTAFLRDGAVLRVPENLVGHQPVHVVFISTGEGPVLSQPRLLILAERNSELAVIQDHVSVGDGARFTNAVSEVVVGPNASVKLVLLQRENDATFHVSNLSARQERDSRFASHTISTGGALIRNDLAVVLADEGADCTCNGLFVGLGDQTIDNHTLVDHAMPHGSSRELYKGILGDKAKGVFRGRVIVRPDAQKTDALQSNPNLLLGDQAEVNTKPQLEIYADDVKCSHGSTIGQIDEDALFFLRARGIGESEARDLLTRGFSSEVLEALEIPSLSASLAELLLARLHAGDDS